jgi:hypothetical protein
MTWSDLPTNPSPKVLRQFSAAWLVFFLAVGARQYFSRVHHEVGIILGAIAILISGLGMIKPVAVRWLFVTCTVLAFPIGWAISQIMLALIFYGLVTPIAFIFRVQGRDLLARKPSIGRATFWMLKKMPTDVSSYFRQY